MELQLLLLRNRSINDARTTTNGSYRNICLCVGVNYSYTSIKRPEHVTRGKGFLQEKQTPLAFEKLNEEVKLFPIDFFSSMFSIRKLYCL